MIPPAGFETALHPLRHRLEYSFGLSMQTGAMNSAMATLVRHTNDIIPASAGVAGVPKMIIVNPKNTGYVKDAGAAVCNMSILDRLSLSLRFNMTEYCLPGNETGSSSWTGDGITSIKLLWRPIFFSFGEKLDAADDDTGTTVKAILGLTKDTTFEDVVPISANKLPVLGSSDKSQPVSTVNIAEVFGDYNMTTNTTMEDVGWDEDLFQEAIMRYTNGGALKSMVGRTRHLTLTVNRPYKNYFIQKFVPKSIRRVQPFTFMAILVHVPLDSESTQQYSASPNSANVAHVGVKMLCHYHEWNNGHYQNPEGVPAISE